MCLLKDTLERLPLLLRQETILTTQTWALPWQSDDAWSLGLVLATAYEAYARCLVKMRQESKKCGYFKHRWSDLGLAISKETLTLCKSDNFALEFQFKYTFHLRRHGL